MKIRFISEFVHVYNTSQFFLLPLPSSLPPSLGQFLFFNKSKKLIIRCTIVLYLIFMFKKSRIVLLQYLITERYFRFL